MHSSKRENCKNRNYRGELNGRLGTQEHRRSTLFRSKSSTELKNAGANHPSKHFCGPKTTRIEFIGNCGNECCLNSLDINGLRPPQLENSGKGRSYSRKVYKLYKDISFLSNQPSHLAESAFSDDRPQGRRKSIQSIDASTSCTSLIMRQPATEQFSRLAENIPCSDAGKKTIIEYLSKVEQMLRRLQPDDSADRNPSQAEGDCKAKLRRPSNVVSEKVQSEHKASHWEELEVLRQITEKCRQYCDANFNITEYACKQGLQAYDLRRKMPTNTNNAMSKGTLHKNTTNAFVSKDKTSGPLPKAAPAKCAVAGKRGIPQATSEVGSQLFSCTSQSKATGCHWPSAFPKATENLSIDIPEMQQSQNDSLESARSSFDRRMFMRFADMQPKVRSFDEMVAAEKEKLKVHSHDKGNILNERQENKKATLKKGPLNRSTAGQNCIEKSSLPKMVKPTHASLQKSNSQNEKICNHRKETNVKKAAEVPVRSQVKGSASPRISRPLQSQRAGKQPETKVTKNLVKPNRATQELYEKRKPKNQTKGKVEPPKVDNDVGVTQRKVQSSEQLSFDALSDVLKRMDAYFMQRGVGSALEGKTAVNSSKKSSPSKVQRGSKAVQQPNLTRKATNKKLQEIYKNQCRRFGSSPDRSLLQ